VSRKYHKKRTYQQRYQAVVMALAKADYQMTGHSIALDMGYQNGNPLRDVIKQLIEEGLVEESGGELFGKPIVWLWMNRENRKIALRKIGYEEE